VNPSPQTWFLMRSKASATAHNMAMDEALLEAAPALAQPVLRFYSWTEPAASFGYFQKHAEIEKATHLRPLVRRPTGGGLVPHDADWTYSLVFPPNDPWYSLKAAASYHHAHEWLRAAFQRLGLDTELASDSRKELPGQCFAGHERSDVLWRGRKIAGAAQRRMRSGLLIQGSVQPPPTPLPLARDTWEQTVCDVARIEFGVRWQEFKPDPSLAARVAELASRKYAQPAYNRRR
jgi:lipoate-protein ligase A